MEANDLLTSSEWRKNISSPPVMVWITLLLMLAFTAFVSSLVHRNVNASAQGSFQGNADKAIEAVELRMNAYEQVLRGGVGLFNSAGNVSRKEWHDYVTSLRIADYFPGIQGIGYSRHVRAAELQQHIRQIRAAGFPEFAIKPPGPRQEYTSIVYLEPFDNRNRRAFGYDMFSEPIRHAAMVRARDTGLASISGKVTLVQETGTDIQAGFLMYLPLFAKNLPVDTVEERRKALTGYVYSPFRMKNLMLGILGKDTKKFDIDLEIYDGDDITQDSLMYDHDSSMTGLSARTTRQFVSMHKVFLNGHTWTLVLSSTPQFDAGIDHTKPVYVALAGVAISLMFFVVGWLLANNRKQAQTLLAHMNTALTEQKSLINAIVDDAADGIVTIDETGKILTFNRAAAHIFGYPASEAEGQNVSMLMPEPYQSGHDGYIRNYLETGQAKIIGSSREVTGKRKSGETFPMDLAISEVMLGTRHRMFAGIVRDISDRKRIEEDLRLSKERFELAIRGAKDGLWDFDFSRQTSYHSPRWNAMLGNPEVETVVPAGSWLLYVHPDDREAARKKVQDYVDGIIPEYIAEHRMRHHDGHYIWVLSRGILQRDAHGKPVRMVGIYTDISKQKQMDSLKSEFVSTVSHELRTPLTAIRGALGLIVGGATGSVNPQAQGMLDIAYRNTGRLLSLINDLLDMDKIQSGKMEFNFKPQLLMPLIEQGITGNQAYADNFRVNFRLLAGLPEAMVNVDGARLIQVMANLLSNAAKFSHEGDEVEITAARHDGTIRIAVTDHGAGIPEEFHDRMFEKFTQADSSDSRHKGGTGLGLNISRAIVESMHGRIGFNSKTGAGATFYIELPEWQADMAG